MCKSKSKGKGKSNGCVRVRNFLAAEVGWESTGSFALRALDDGVKQAKAKATTDADSSAAPQNDGVKQAKATARAKAEAGFSALRGSRATLEMTQIGCMGREADTSFAALLRMRRV